MTSEITLPWPDWQVTKLLGAGGYGRVYEIHRDRYGISEAAAVKVLSFPKDEDEISEGLRSGYVEETLAAEYRQQVESVLKEYRLLKELGDDPHIVRCDDYAAVPHSNGIGWNVYLKMELLTPLKQYLGKSAIPPEQTVQLGSDICQALAACWAKRILHRDIKPDNILVSGKGVFKLSDFGEAKLVEKTMASGVAGTWSFVAPEVGNHSRYGEPADIYSLGMVLYWMLNRCTLPFLPRPWGLCSTAEQDQARQRRLSGEPLPPPADGSPALKKVVLKACAFRPEERYATPDELREALWAALRGTAPAGNPPSRSAEHSMPTMPDGDGVSGNWAADSRWSGEPSSMKDERSEGTMGCSWAAPSFEWGESSMPADSDLEETMPADGEPVRQEEAMPSDSGPVQQKEAQPAKGNDLYREVSITPEQAEAGCQITVEGYKGAKLNVTVPANCQNGKQLRRRGRGYPGFNGGKNGDLYVTVQIEATPPAHHAAEENTKSAAKSEGNKPTAAKKKGLPFWIVLVIIAAIVFFQHNKQSGGEKPNSDVSSDSSTEASCEVSYFAGDDYFDPYILLLPNEGGNINIDIEDQQIDEIQAIIREKDCHTLRIGQAGGSGNIGSYYEVSSQLLARIVDLEGIECIEMYWCDKITGLEHLSGLSELTTLSISSCRSIDLNEIAALQGLSDLKLNICEIDTIEPLTRLKSLRTLDLGFSVLDLAQLAMLAQLPNLDRLVLSNCKLSNLEPLATLKNIRSLNLWDNQIADLSPLSGLSQLTELNIGMNQIRNLTPLSGMTQLESLYAEYNQINDLTPLSNLTRLTVIWVKDNQITSLDGLENLRELRGIWLSGNPVTDTSALEVSGRTEALHLE